MVPSAAERGAVHILFLIGVLVLGLAFGALWFVEFQDNEKLVAETAAANAEIAELEDKLNYAKNWYKPIAAAVGVDLLPPEIPIPESAEARDGLAAQRAAGSTPGSTEGPVPNINARLDQVRASAELSIKSDSLSAAATGPLTALADARSTIKKRSEIIEEQKRELARMRASHETAMAEVERRRQTDLTDYNADRAAKDQALADEKSERERESSANADALALRDEEARAEAEKTKALNSDVKRFGREVSRLNNERTFERETAPFDGSIVSVDPVTKIASLDLSKRDLLHPGIRFEVFGLDKAGKRLSKGFVTVTQVGELYSSAKITSETAAAGGIGGGDRLVSPVFSKNSPVRFAFLGTQNGAYSKATATALLERAGAKVDNAISVSTDFVILGSEEDEDDQAALLSGADYQNVVSWGITVLRARDLEPFIRR